MSQMWTKSALPVHKLYSTCPPLARTQARCLPLHWSIVSSKINCSRPQQTSMSRRFNLFTFMDLSVVDTMLHDSPYLVIHRTEIWAVWRPQVGRKKVWRFLTQQFNCCMCVAECAGALSCWNKVATRHSAYRWQPYGVIITTWSSIEEVSKRYHQNFLLCNNNEITACIGDLLFNSFCGEVYAVAFLSASLYVSKRGA